MEQQVRTHLVNLVVLERLLKDLEVVEVLVLLSGAEVDARHGHVAWLGLEARARRAGGKDRATRMTRRRDRARKGIGQTEGGQRVSRSGRAEVGRRGAARAERCRAQDGLAVLSYAPYIESRICRDSPKSVSPLCSVAPSKFRRKLLAREGRKDGGQGRTNLAIRRSAAKLLNLCVVDLQ